MLTAVKCIINNTTLSLNALMSPLAFSLSPLAFLDREHYFKSHKYFWWYGSNSASVCIVSGWNELVYFCFMYSYVQFKFLFLFPSLSSGGGANEP